MVGCEVLGLSITLIKGTSPAGRSNAVSPEPWPGWLTFFLCLSSELLSVGSIDFPPSMTWGLLRDVAGMFVSCKSERRNMEEGTFWS